MEGTATGMNRKENEHVMSCHDTVDGCNVMVRLKDGLVEKFWVERGEDRRPLWWWTGGEG